MEGRAPWGHGRERMGTGESKPFKRATGPYVASGFSRLETLPEHVIEKLKRREFAPGEIIGDRYKLLSLLGAGAMGQVFQAENMMTKVDVAVKLLKPELIANHEFRSRFQKEAEAVGSISHQNVARFFDLVVGDPTFLVMEHVPGPTLQQLIDTDGKVPLERALGIAIRLCWGLEAAHAHGIVHRDLKPANIIVAKDVEVGDQPKIIDFGLAKLAVKTQSEELTRTGQIVGTPEYMAPEQIEGRPIDARADVYALGCVLYKMIAGATPFAGDDDVQVLYRQLHTAPKKLSELVPGVPEKLDEVLARALAKKPADRYPDTRSLAEALGRSHDRRRGAGRISVEAIARQKKPHLALIGATALAVGAVGGLLLGRLQHTSHAELPEPSADAEPAPPSPVARSLLVVTSTPIGAKVELDGKALEQATPTVIAGIAPGNHLVRLSAPGRTTIDRNITLAKDDREVLSITLPAPQRSVLVRSVPGGAMLYVDGHVAGPAPQTVVVSPDDFHELRLEKIGFDPLVHALGPDDHEEELTLSMELEAAPHSELMIDSKAEAEVWIDGADTAVETPTMGLRVTPGKHTVQLRDSSGATSKLTTITVSPGERLRLVMNL